MTLVEKWKPFRRVDYDFLVGKPRNKKGDKGVRLFSGDPQKNVFVLLASLQQKRGTPPQHTNRMGQVHQHNLRQPSLHCLEHRRMPNKDLVFGRLAPVTYEIAPVIATLDALPSSTAWSPFPETQAPLSRARRAIGWAARRVRRL